MSSAAEKFFSTNTLAFAVALTVGKVTTVEMRNESHVTGRIVEADGFMNVTMKEATFVDPTGRKRKFEQFFVPGRLIRYVQIPTEIDIQAAIKKKFDPTEVHTRGRGRGRGDFKVGGARKKIEAMRDQRRQEDIAAALKLKSEMAKKNEKS